jgi:hypothetical protein
MSDRTDTEPPTDPLLLGSIAAMRRAATAAHLNAKRTGTRLVYWSGEAVVYVAPYTVAEPREAPPR